MNWAQKTVLVTGGGSGIGKEITRLMINRGAHVIVATLLDEEIQALKQDLPQGRGTLTGIAIDLTSDNAIAGLMNTLEARSLVPTVLVNNAGSGLLGAHKDLDREKMRKVLDLNIQVLTEMCSVFAEKLINRNLGGSILNVASIGAFVPVPHLAAYTASKHYVLSFTHSLAHELAPYGIHVGALCPGITRTKIYDSMGLKTEKQSKGSISDHIDAFAMDADKVALCAIHAIETNKRLALPGINRAAPLFRLLPPRFTSWVLYKFVGDRAVS
ncbi:SDR family NAD(P)-dependent oxidoreductase [Alcanivorax sediminis]|nr:SDR family NAD(P)-dependent oxidoreductase [Alcanivorax sediminis]